jgi:hypothetical protein
LVGLNSEKLLYIWIVMVLASRPKWHENYGRAAPS